MPSREELDTSKVIQAIADNAVSYPNMPVGKFLDEVNTYSRIRGQDMANMTNAELYRAIQQYWARDDD